MIMRIWKWWAAWWDDDGSLTTDQQEQLGAFNRWMYDAIFGVAVGSTCDPETGHIMATKYGRWVLRRKGRDEMDIEATKEQIKALTSEIIIKRGQLARLAGQVVTELERLDRQDTKEYIRACYNAADLAVEAGCWDISQQMCRKGLEVVRKRTVWTYLDYPNMERKLTQVMGKAIVLCDLWNYHH